MDEQPSDSLDRAIARIVELETLYTHLQRTLVDLDQVVLDQQRQLDQLAKRVAAMTAEVQRVSGSEPEVRKPEDERPPHY